MAKILIALASALAITSTILYLNNVKAPLHAIEPHVDQMWNNWKQTHNKVYTPTEEIQRQAIFHNNYHKISAHMANETRTFNMSFNQFMDLTTEEFLAAKSGHMKVAPKTQLEGFKYLDASNLPTEVDWRAKGMVSRVKNQARCGDCWAFSTTGAIESMNAINGGEMIEFSEQQLTDCSFSYGNHGCHGGIMDNAFRYVIDHGLVLEEQYPFVGYQGRCRVRRGNFYISDYVDLPSEDLDQLAAAVNQQPISIAVDASNWQFYSGGILDIEDFNGLNHAVLLVGYTEDAWIVKNSWTEQWGEEGYVRVARGNTCGIGIYSTYPVA